MTAPTWWQPTAQQATFRAVLDGFARPGTVVPLGDAHASAHVVLLAALLDESVTLADPHALLSPDHRRVIAAPDAPPAQARFVLLDGREPAAPALQPALGSLASPELGATLVLLVNGLSTAPGLTLHGPGIDGTRSLQAAGLHPSWLTRRATWVNAFPLGVDLVLAAPRAVAALPRSTRITDVTHVTHVNHVTHEEG